MTVRQDGVRGARRAPFRRDRPLRVSAALAELLAAVLLAALAWWLWHRGVTVTVQRGVALRRIEGPWWAGATAAATLAGMGLLDAARQVIRALRPPGAPGPRPA